MTTIDGFSAVIPAGGAGTRLWPVSRVATPKFLLDLTGSGRTLLQATVDRLVPLAGDHVLVVTGARHRDQVVAQVGPGVEVMAEPSPRDSMAAIGWAAAVLEARDPEAVLGSFAADHVIGDLPAFEACVREAVEVARTGAVVTIGIEPTYAATGFGYIRSGAPMVGFATARHAVEFVEKPDQARAEVYLDSGEFRWNAGIFVVRAAVLLDLLARWHPGLAAGLRALAADPSLLEEAWPRLERIAVDHAVAEPAADAGLVAVVPGTFPWDDVGDFASLASLAGLADGAAGAISPDRTVGSTPADAGDDTAGAISPNRTVGSHPTGAGGTVTVVGDASLVQAVDSSGFVMPADGRTIAVVGLDDVVVVDTGDAVLVTTRDRAQDVKKVVDALKESGRNDLL